MRIPSPLKSVAGRPGPWSWVLLVGALGCFAAAPARSATLPPADTAAHSRSVFIDNYRLSKDPFFPKSRRRENMALSTRSQGELPSGLVLGGLSGSKEKRLALINNKTLAVGEEADIKVDGQTIRLRCLEIRERSVLVTFDGLGEPKELRLRRDL